MKQGMSTLPTRIDGSPPPIGGAKVSAITVSRSLSELRRERGMSQKQLAEAMGVSQPSVSRQEKRSDREDIQLSSLRSVVAAMGGRLEVIARFPEGSVKITDCTGIDNPY